MKYISKREKSIGNAGFTLIEVIVIVAILAILAGILTPMVFKQIDDAKEARALADAKAISTAILVFRKDTGQWPNKAFGCLPNVTILKGATGNDPQGIEAFNQTTPQYFDDILTSDGNNCWPYDNNSKIGWKGPYLKNVPTDPWGNVYVVNAEHFGTDTPVLVFSAGPNGRIDTGLGNMSPGEDDIAVLMSIK